jgi:hypothetical protein
MAAELSRVCAPREADGYLRFVDYARRLWRPSRYAEELAHTLEEHGYVGFRDGIEVSKMVTPADWADAGLAAGTQPGVGVPMVLISRTLAAARVMGCSDE